MIQKSNLLLFSFLLSIASAQVDLSNKIRYYSDGLTDAFHLVNVIRPTPHTYTTYSDTSICRADECDTPSSVSAYEISYQNQGTVHACICDNAVFDIAYMADNVGRVPYLVRKNVISYTAASVGKGGGAFASAGQIVFFDEQENTEVFIHESGHVFDGSNGGLSTNQAYYNDISNDACVPDGYAATNPVEDFAQLTVTWTALVLLNRETPSCLSQSISYLAQVLPRSFITSSLTTYDQTAPTSSPSSAPTSSPTSAPVTSAPVTSAPAPTSCTLAVRQTYSNSWQSSGVTYTQYSAVFINNGASDVQSSNLAVYLSGAQITQIWNLQQNRYGEYVLPSYQSTVAAGQQYSWGYIVQGTSPVNVAFDLPASCSPSAPTSAPTSAPVTSAPTSAPATKAPTSAPVTSAPTSAPATKAPTTTPTTPGSCSFDIRQTQANSWVSGGVTYTQWNVLYRNAGSTSAAPVVQLSGGVITQIWNVEAGNNGYYYLPSYQASLAPNQQYSWGYVVESANALAIRLIC